MPIPQSFIRDGFKTFSDARKMRNLPGLKRPGIMIGSEGEKDTGKTEFILSCPGPGIVLAVDRGYDTMMDNPYPPHTRRDDFVFDEIKLAMASMKENYVENWNNFYGRLMTAIKNPDARTVAIDGDSDTWETQRLAQFGKLTQIPSILYADVNAARRAMYYRCFDSGKIIVATNKVRDEYVIKRDDAGNPILKDGKETREKSGNLARQGFEDENYLFSLQIRHLYKPASINKITKKEMPHQWGIRILKCKPNPGIQGEEIWGSDANFAGLIQLAYPNEPLSVWGL